ncbi:DNA-processing protein DprA [Arthrobacter sp. Bz4]|uniref:DNA-processing protein DprA n=1 Tax=Arthrobacter sp. Bz4 TaxID=2171979 RepID=UPI000D5125F3|nr:DNA-processing protein DprA [Arthrobacter sp. Bz4]PVE20050.1 DNA-protecting protein DprA [Arthrobacter sp. Bz4]
MTSYTNPTVVARAALSRLFEPSDTVGLALTLAAGPIDALRIATGRISAGSTLPLEVAGLLESQGISIRPQALIDALERWRPRVADLAPERDLATLERLGGILLTPESEGWPNAIDDLQLSAPSCLWIRGNYSRGIPELNRMVAVVGSRDSTAYGTAVTGDLAAGLVTRGYTVVSGGAYGIDAQAHRSALAAADDERTLPTIGVTACGIDRYYPAGNEQLLRETARRGLLVAEVPPGASPTRWRFLQRNRLIAALCAVTVVVEARWRSGALNTAHHAAGLGRSVGAVPGSVFSANSAGCHRLMREGSAICVTDAAEIAELAGPIGSVMVPEPDGEHAVHDGLTVEDILLLDALPVRASTTIDKLASVAGLSIRDVLAGLSRLELSTLAERTHDGGWRRGAPHPDHNRPHTKPKKQ